MKLQAHQERSSASAWIRPGACHRSTAGFTLIEMVVLLALFAIAAALAFPALRMIFAKARVESTVQQTATVLYSTRLQAIREATTAYVEFGPIEGRDWAWATIDRNRDGIFESELGGVSLREDFQFAGPPTDSDGIDGWTDDRLEFRSDGSVAEAGAVRIAANVGDDVWYYEVRVAPAAAPRIQVRKWDSLANEWVEEGDD